MKRATFATLSAALTFATVIAPSTPVNAQSYSEVQHNSKQQIESANKPQGCQYFPGWGYWCW